MKLSTHRMEKHAHPLSISVIDIVICRRWREKNLKREREREEYKKSCVKNVPGFMYRRKTGLVSSESIISNVRVCGIDNAWQSDVSGSWTDGSSLFQCIFDFDLSFFLFFSSSCPRYRSVSSLCRKLWHCSRRSSLPTELIKFEKRNN